MPLRNLDSWLPKLFDKGRYPHLSRLARLMGLRMYSLLALLLVPLGMIRNLWLHMGPGAVQLLMLVFLLWVLRLRLRSSRVRWLTRATLLLFPMSAYISFYWRGSAEPPTLLIYPLLVYMLTFTQDRAGVLAFGLLGLALPYMHYAQAPAADLQAQLRRWDLGLLTLIALFAALAYRAAAARLWAAMLRQRAMLTQSLQATRELGLAIQSGMRSSLGELKARLAVDSVETRALAKAMESALLAARRTLANSRLEPPHEAGPVVSELERSIRYRALKAFLVAGLTLAVANLAVNLALEGPQWSLSLLYASLLGAILFAMPRDLKVVRWFALLAAGCGASMVLVASWEHQGARVAANLMFMACFIAFAVLAHSLRLGLILMLLGLAHWGRLMLLNRPASLAGIDLAWNINVAELLLAFALISYGNWKVLEVALKLCIRRAGRLQAAQLRLALLARGLIHDLASPVMELNLNLSAGRLSPEDRQELTLLADRLETILGDAPQSSQRPSA